MFSNRYIFIYSTILVVVVAAVLAFAALMLQPFQDKNAEVEKIQNLLASINVSSTPENAESLYDKHFIEELAIDKNGNVVSSYKNRKLLQGDVRPFNIDLKSEQYKNQTGGNPAFPLYIYEKDGEQGYVVPLLGTGLWGPVWGNIAFAGDFNKVVGTTFGHKGETPGLGAEIALPVFQHEFINKQIFDESGTFKSIAVKKAADKNSPYEVDAISGGTITSTGVSNMIHDCLAFYQPYILKLKTQ